MNTVSLTCLTTRDYEDNAKAVEKTLKVLSDKINITKLYWFSNRPYPRNCDINIEWIYINVMDRSTWPGDYNRVVLDLLPRVLDTDFNLIIHNDGFAVNAAAWTDEFFDYDYIGARWSFLDQFSKYDMGNGGFTLRSKRLYDAVLDLKIDYQTSPQEFTNHVCWSVLKTELTGKIAPEDSIICVLYRDILEKEYNIRFAPAHLADQFSIEGFWADKYCPWLGKSLGFHGRHGIHLYYGVKI